RGVQRVLARAAAGALMLRRGRVPPRRAVTASGMHRLYRLSDSSNTLGFSKRSNQMRCAAFFCLFLMCASSAAAQPDYDLLLKGGHVIDSRNGINAVRDVAIKDGKIAAVAADIPVARAVK